MWFGPNGHVITECEVKLSRLPGSHCGQLLLVLGRVRPPFVSKSWSLEATANGAIMIQIAAKLLNR